MCKKKNKRRKNEEKQYNKQRKKWQERDHILSTFETSINRVDFAYVCISPYLINVSNHFVAKQKNNTRSFHTSCMLG